MENHAMYRRVKRVHFVGIGGIGMSGIAEVMLNLGYQVSGSDLKESAVTRRLKKLGARIAYGHRKENLADAQVLVYSSAVKEDNLELMAARERLIPLVPRGEMLAELMRMKYGIAVAGSHGKTTTTSLIASILAHAGLDPTAVIGGRVKAMDSNAKLGQGEFLVCEADESDGSFLRLCPTMVVVTNIDAEHLDYYHHVEQLEACFRQFIELVPFYGLAVVCWDHPRVRKVLTGYRRRFASYGLSPEAQFSASEVKFCGFKTVFQPSIAGRKMGPVELPLTGFHNVLNALAAMAVASELEVKFPMVREALEGFSGVERRFQIKGQARGIVVVDDYGHHPEEIKATLSSAKRCERNRTVVIFQPHRYTRTQALFNDFLDAFKDADILLITDIYPAGEEPIPGVRAELLVEELKGRGKAATYLPDKAEMVAKAVNLLKPGDLVITLGAGDIWTVADELVKRLQE